MADQPGLPREEPSSSLLPSSVDRMRPAPSTVVSVEASQVLSGSFPSPGDRATAPGTTVPQKPLESCLPCPGPSPARLAEVFDQAVAQLRKQLQSALEKEVLGPLLALQAENAQLREQLYKAAALPSGDALPTSATQPALSPQGVLTSIEGFSADAKGDEKAHCKFAANAAILGFQPTNSDEGQQNDRKKKMIKRRKQARSSKLATIKDSQLEEEREEAEQSLEARLERERDEGSGRHAKHHRHSRGKSVRGTSMWSANHASRGSVLSAFSPHIKYHKQHSRLGSLSSEPNAVPPTKVGRHDVDGFEELITTDRDRLSLLSDELKKGDFHERARKSKQLRNHQSTRSDGAHFPLLSRSSTNEFGVLMSADIPRITQMTRYDNEGPDGLFILHEIWMEIHQSSSQKLLKSGRGIQDRSKSHMSMAHTQTDNESDTPSEVAESKGGCCASLQQRYMVQPNSLKRLSWEFMGLMLISWDIIWLPLLLFEPGESLGIHMAAWVARVFWTLDIPGSFLTGYITKEGILVMCAKKVSKHYMRTRMCFDCFIVGADWIEVLASTTASFLSAARLGKVLRTFRVLRMIRLARMLKLPGILDKMTERIFSEKAVLIMDILKSTLFIIIIAHITACFWYKLGSMQKDNWLKEYEYHHQGLDLQYVVSLHWSIARFIGEPPVVSTNLPEHVFEIFTLIASFVMSAAFVSTITTSMTRLQLIGVEDQSNFSTLRRYLRVQNVSSRLAMRITRNARFAVKQAKARLMEDDVVLFQLLSEPLMIELHYEVYGHVLKEHPAFELYCLSSPQAMRKVCHGSVSLYQMSKGELLFNKGERPDHGHMLMLMSGKMKYEVDNYDVQHIEQGQWASEMVLWASWVHCGNLRTESDCSLVALSSEKFQKIGARDFDTEESLHPSFYAKWFVQKMNELDLFEMTDLDPGFGLPAEMISAKLDILNPKKENSNGLGPWRPDGVKRGSGIFQDWAEALSWGVSKSLSTKPRENR